MGRRVAGAVLVAVLLVGAGCGDDAGDGEAVADVEAVLDAGLLDEAGLEESTGLVWEETDEVGDDTDLPACEELTTVGEAALADVVAEEGSATFAGDVPGGATTTSAIVRSAVLVYADEAAAEAALTSVDADLLVACIAPSVPDDAVDEIEVGEGPAPDLGDEAVALGTELDDYVFFAGNDNFHRTDLVVARTGPVLVAVQVIASSQSFEGVAVAAVVTDAAAPLVGAVEEAQ